MDDEERKLWLVGEIALESRLHVEDLDGLGRDRLTRAQALIDAGYRMEILTEAEASRIGEAVLAGETDSLAFRELTD